MGCGGKLLVFLVFLATLVPIHKVKIMKEPSAITEMKRKLKRSPQLLATSHFIALIRECCDSTSSSCFVITFYYPLLLLQSFWRMYEMSLKLIILILCSNGVFIICQTRGKQFTCFINFLQPSQGASVSPILQMRS